VELTATALSPRSLFWRRFETEGDNEGQSFDGESVSQSRLKDKAFSAFVDQNPRVELRQKTGSRLRKGLSIQWPVESPLFPNINDDLAGSGCAFDCSMSLLDRVETEMA
jgi:hypothetical protein